MQLVQTLGVILREARKCMGLTQTELAQDLCDRSYLSHIEQDKIMPAFDLVVQLAERLRINPLELVETFQRQNQHAFKMIRIDALIKNQQMTEAYNSLEAAWWDAARTRDTVAIREIAKRLPVLFSSNSCTSLGWPHALILWLVDNGCRNEAMDVGLAIQSHLFKSKKWSESAFLGRTLLTLNAEATYRARLALTTGSALIRIGNVQAAEIYYSDAKDIGQVLSRKDILARASHGLSAIYGGFGKLDEGLTEAQNAVNLYGSPNTHLYWLAWQNVGILTGQIGKREKGRKILKECYRFWKVQNDIDRLGELSNDLKGLDAL